MTKIYGTYSVFNIPYYEHIGGGEGAGGWQLIVVENCDITVPMRAVRLRMSADFNIDDVSKTRWRMGRERYQDRNAYEYKVKGI